jgi:hypothetical protein
LADVSPWSREAERYVPGLLSRAQQLIDEEALPGTLGAVLLLSYSPLLILQGGGNSPLYPPNKAVVFHDSLGIPIAELEFG